MVDMIHFPDILNFPLMIIMMTRRFDLDYTPSIMVSHKTTLMPRLSYSVDLLEEILVELKKHRSSINKQNRNELTNLKEYEESEIKQLELEKILTFSVESLTKIQKKIQSLAGISSIPIVLPPTIPVLRTISAQLFEVLPVCSGKLCDISITLGSIVMDSGTITEAKFDFRETNLESNTLLDEAKLIVDSKINKLYPNLDSFKANYA